VVPTFESVDGIQNAYNVRVVLRVLQYFAFFSIFNFSAMKSERVIAEEDNCRSLSR